MRHIKYAFASFILLFSCFTFAKQTPYKDWFYSIDGGGYNYAGTLNKSSHILGQYCYLDSEKCVYLVGVDITCKTGSEYPALVNAESGSFPVTLYCGDKVDNQNVMIVVPFDNMDVAVRENNQLGIAIPMESGKFKVSRFSLLGSSHSLDTMRDVTAKAINSKPVVDDSELL